MKYSAEVAFHQAIRAPLIKSESIGKSGKYKNVDFELKQLVSESLVSGGVADVFKIAGLESPDISILSDEFLAEVEKMPQKNLAVELLQKLMKDEMKTRFKNNIVKQKQFSELLRNALDKYQNRAIEAAHVIEELIKMAKEIKKDLNDSKYATGRRKKSIARVWLKKGGGAIFVNGKKMIDNRIKRLVGSGQIVKKGNNYFIGNLTMLFITKIVLLAKIIIIGKKSEFN